MSIVLYTVVRAAIKKEWELINQLQFNSGTELKYLEQNELNWN